MPRLLREMYINLVPDDIYGKTYGVRGFFHHILKIEISITGFAMSTSFISRLGITEGGCLLGGGLAWPLSGPLFTPPPLPIAKLLWLRGMRLIAEARKVVVRNISMSFAYHGNWTVRPRSISDSEAGPKPKLPVLEWFISLPVVR